MIRFFSWKCLRLSQTLLNARLGVTRVVSTITVVRFPTNSQEISIVEWNSVVVFLTSGQEIEQQSN